MITQERLKEVLRYDQETGVFSRIAPKGISRVPNTTGYIRIKVDGTQYKAHSLAWLYQTGEWPKGVIDHKDGNRMNLRFSNLRDVSVAVNTQNQRRPHKNGSTGYLGVSLNKRTNKFVAQIMVGGRVRYLGSFQDPAAAHECYLESKRAFHSGCTI